MWFPSSKCLRSFCIANSMTTNLTHNNINNGILYLYVTWPLNVPHVGKRRRHQLVGGRGFQLTKPLSCSDTACMTPVRSGFARLWASENHTTSFWGYLLPHITLNVVTLQSAVLTKWPFCYLLPWLRICCCSKTFLKSSCKLRPIALTSIVSKLFHEMMAKRLTLEMHQECYLKGLYSQSYLICYDVAKNPLEDRSSCYSTGVPFKALIWLVG